MSTEKPKSLSTGENTSNKAAFRFWLFALLGSSLLMVLLTWGLYQVFDLTKDRLYGVMPVMVPILLAAAAKPTSYRDSAILAVLGGIAGALAWPLLTGVLALAEGLGPPALRDTARFLGAVLCPIPLAMGACVIFQRLRPESSEAHSYSRES